MQSNTYTDYDAFAGSLKDVDARMMFLNPAIHSGPSIRRSCQKHIYNWGDWEVVISSKASPWPVGCCFMFR